MTPGQILTLHVTSASLSTVMAGHNARERRLFTDLNEKNRLAGEFRRLSNSVRQWQDRMGKRRGERWQKRYGQAIRRAEVRLEELQRELPSRAEDLKTRIEEEQQISKSEIEAFEKQYKKEVRELKKAQEKLAAAGEAFSKAEAETKSRSMERQQTAAVLAELSRKRRNAAREARRETKDVKTAEKEITSEEQDKQVLSYELRRIVAEIEALRG